MVDKTQTPKEANEQPGKDIGATIIKLEFSLTEVQTILNHMGNAPHNQVRALIDKIAEQTNPQIPQPKVAEPAE